MADTGSPGMVLFAYISFALGGVLVVGGCIYMIIWAFCNKCLPCRNSGNKGDGRQVGHAKYMDKNLSGRGNASAQEGDTESLNYEGHTFLPQDATTGKDKGHKQTQAQVEAQRRSNGAAVSIHEESEVGMVRRESSKKKDDKKRRGMVIGAGAAATATAVVAGATTIIISEHDDDEGRHDVVGDETNTMRIDNAGSLQDDQPDTDSYTNLVHNEHNNTFMSAAVVDESMGDGHSVINEPTSSGHYTDDNLGREEYIGQSSFHREEFRVEEHIESVGAASVVPTERVQAFSDDYPQEGSRSFVIGGQEQEDWRSQGMEFSTDTDSIKLDDDNRDRNEFGNFAGIERDQTSMLHGSFGVEEVSYQQDSIVDLGRKGSIDELVQHNSQEKPFVSDLTDSMQKDYEIDDEVKYNGEHLSEMPHSMNNDMALIEREDSFHVRKSNPVDLSNPDLQEEVTNNDERLLQQLQDIDEQDSVNPAGRGLTLIQTNPGEGNEVGNTEVVNERPIYSDTDERESDEDRGMSVMAVGVTGASLAANKILRKKKKRSSLFSKERKGEDEEAVEMTSLEPQSIDSPDKNDNGEGGKRMSKKEMEKEEKIRKQEKQKEEELQRKMEKEKEKERKKLMEREKRESKKVSKKQKGKEDTHNIVATAVPLVAASRDNEEDMVVERENFTEERIDTSHSAEEESQRFNEEGHVVDAAAIPILETSRESKREKERQRKEKELQMKRDKEEEKLRKKQQEQEEKERKKMSKKKKVIKEFEEQQQSDGDSQEVRVSDVALVAASNIERTKTHQTVDERSQEKDRKKELERQERESKKERQRQQKEDEIQRKREKEEEKLRKKQQEKEDRASRKKSKIEKDEVEEIQDERDHEVMAAAVKESKKDKKSSKIEKEVVEVEEIEDNPDHEVTVAAVPIVAAVKESKNDKKSKKEGKKAKIHKDGEETMSDVENLETPRSANEELHERDDLATVAAVPIVQASGYSQHEEETSREEEKGGKERKKEKEKEEKERKKELERQERESKKERERQQKEDELQRKREKEEEKLRKKQQEKEERASRKKSKIEKEEVEVEEIEDNPDHEVTAAAVPIVAAVKESKKDKKSKKESKKAKVHKDGEETMSDVENLETPRSANEELHERDDLATVAAVPIVQASGYSQHEEETSREEEKGGKQRKKEKEKEEKERKKELEHQERESKKERERQQKEDELQRKREKEEEKLRKKQQEKEERASRKKSKIEKEEVEVEEIEDNPDHEVTAAAVPIVAAVKESKKDKKSKKQSKKAKVHKDGDETMSDGENVETTPGEDEESYYKDHLATGAVVPIVGASRYSQQEEETNREEGKGEKERKKEKDKEERERKKELEHQERESKKERERQQKEDELQRKKEKEEEKLRKKQQEKEDRASRKKSKIEKDEVEEIQDERDHEVMAAAVKESKKDKKSKKESKKPKVHKDGEETMSDVENLETPRAANEELHERDDLATVAAVPIVQDSGYSQHEEETSREEEKGGKERKKEKEKEEKERKKELERQERESKKERERQQKEDELQRKREKEEEKLRKKQQEKEERASRKKSKIDKEEVEVEEIEDNPDHEVTAAAVPIVAAVKESKKDKKSKKQSKKAKVHKDGEETMSDMENIETTRAGDEESHNKDHLATGAAVPIVQAASQQEEETSREEEKGGKERKKEKEKEEKERKKELERQERESKKEREHQQKEDELQRKREKEEEKLKKKQKEQEERESKKMKKKQKEETEEEEPRTDEEEQAVGYGGALFAGGKDSKKDKKSKKKEKDSKKKKKEDVGHGEEEEQMEGRGGKGEDDLQDMGRQLNGDNYLVEPTAIPLVATSSESVKEKKRKKDKRKSKNKEEQNVEEIENERNNFREDQEVDNGLVEEFPKNDLQRESSDSKKEKKKSWFGFRKSKRSSGTEEDSSNVLYAAAPIAGTAVVGAVTAAVVTATGDRTSEHEPDVGLPEEAPGSAWQEHNVRTTDTHEDERFSSNLLPEEHATVLNKNLLPAEGDSDSLLIADSPGPRARSSPILYEEDEYQDSSFGATGGMAIKKELATRDDEGYQTHDPDGDSSTREIQFDRDSSGEQRPLIENDDFDDTRHQNMEEQRKSGLDIDQTHDNQGYGYSHNDEMRENEHLENTHRERQSYTESTDLHRETEVSSYHDNGEIEREHVIDVRASASGLSDWEEATESQLSTGRTEQTSVTSAHSHTWDSQSAHGETAGSVMAVGPSFTDELQASARQNSDDDEELPISKSILADIRQKRNLKAPIRSDSVDSSENKDGTLFDELHTVLRSKKKEDRASAEIAYDVDDTRYTGNAKLANEHLTEEYDISKFNVRARASLFEKITENTGEKVIPSFGGVTSTQSYIRPLSPTVMRLAEGASVKSSLSDTTTEHRDVITDAESDQVEYHYKPSRDSLATTDRMTPTQDEQSEYQHKPARDSLVSRDLQSYRADEHGEQDEQVDESLTNGHFQTFDRNEDSFDEPVDAIKPSVEETEEGHVSSYKEEYGGTLDEDTVHQPQVPETSTGHDLTNGDYVTNGHSESRMDKDDSHHSFYEEFTDKQDLDMSITNIKVKELNRMAIHDNFNSDVDASMVF